MTEPSHRSDIFRFGDELVDTLAALDPALATYLGVAGSDHLLTDYSREHHARRLATLRRAVDEIEALEPLDDIDRIARDVMIERLAVESGLIETNEMQRTFSVLESPVGNIRQVFEMMENTTAESAEIIRQRLEQVAVSFGTWQSSLEGSSADDLPARRHVVGVANQALVHANGSYREFAERVASAAGVDVDESGLVEAARSAEAACRELSRWLTKEIVPLATAPDASGRRRYERWLAFYSGVSLDLDELYEWGYRDLRRINERMWKVANTLLPGARTLKEVAAHLNADPERRIVGTDALLAMLKSFTARTVEQLDGVHFEIDERIRFCDARIAPEGSAAAPYYMAPSEDFTRPGTTWFPTLGATTFAWWPHASTWYHESVPGHHLQVATAMLAAERQTRFHRSMAWYAGYCEGWALYAERLMDELGFFTDPGDEMGFLSCQALRAARIVIDLGLHLELDAPADLGELGDLGDCSGQRWTPEMAVALLEEWAITSPAMAQSEVERYLGVPAQAISYKVGERAWLEARSNARERLGATFTNKAFHRYALTMGALGLDAFAREMATWTGE